jgi:RNA polymerase sigma-70 factor, ECF subfamily
MFASVPRGFLPAERVVAGADQDPPDWLAALSAAGAPREEALRRLRALMLAAARHQVWRMHSALPTATAATLDELANSAANDAMAALLAKLDTFEGRSRFTTWAYKFAILQAATEVRRRAWVGREVSLDGLGDLGQPADPGPSPEQHAEAVDLAAAVQQAMRVALTAHQRKIAVALIVDQAPIDVLADRLGTTRGALYKTLHDVRNRLRAHLTSTGHLPPTTPPAGTA